MERKFPIKKIGLLLLLLGRGISCFSRLGIHAFQHLTQINRKLRLANFSILIRFKFKRKKKLIDKTGSKDCGNYTAVDTKKKCIPIIFEANAADRLDSFKAKQKKIVVMTVKMGDRNNRVESNNVRNIFRQLLCKWH